MQITTQLNQVPNNISGNGYGGQNLNRYPGHSPLRCLSGWPHKLCASGSSFPNARRQGTPSWLHMAPGITHVHVANTFSSFKSRIDKPKDRRQVSDIRDRLAIRRSMTS